MSDGFMSTSLLNLADTIFLLLGFVFVRLAWSENGGVSPTPSSSSRSSDSSPSSRSSCNTLRTHGGRLRNSMRLWLLRYFPRAYGRTTWWRS